MGVFSPPMRAYVSPTRPRPDGPADSGVVSYAGTPADRAGSDLRTDSGRNDLQIPEEVPDTRSPQRFLLWCLWMQRHMMLASIALGLFRYLPGMLTPYLLGRAVDTGITTHDWRATLVWAGWLLLVIVVGVLADVAQSLTGVATWLIVMYRVMKLVVRKVAQMSHVVTRRVPNGEMLSIASSDSDVFGALGDVAARVVVSLLSVVVVGALVIRESTTLGLIVLIASPLMLLMTSPLLRPIQRAQRIERERSSKLTGMAVDIVSGIRILRGVGGERTFGDNYAAQSQRLRQAGTRAGTWWATLDSLSLVLNGILLVAMMWLGTRELIAGRLTIGQLISFFGYATFLQRPFMVFWEFAQKWIQAVVSAQKTLGLLSQEPPWVSPETVADLRLGEIVDEASGFVARPGELTIVVSAVPDDSAALVDRIGRYLPPSNDVIELTISEQAKGRRAKAELRKKDRERAARAAQDEERASGRWGVSVDGVDLSDLELAEVRRRIVVSDAGAQVFAGTLQQLVDPHERHTRGEAEEALYVASAEDVWDALPEGWQGRIDERGRGLSGGQRQRLVLARALLLDPEVLILVEPTSAVDAHTEARIAERLPGYRRGETTIITTVSPLWLRQADRVVLLGPDGQAIAQGTHADLLAESAAYRDVVVRGDGAAVAVRNEVTHV